MRKRVGNIDVESDDADGMTRSERYDESRRLGKKDAGLRAGCRCTIE
jgi:hypothetical protein